MENGSNALSVQRDEQRNARGATPPLRQRSTCNGPILRSAIQRSEPFGLYIFFFTSKMYNPKGSLLCTAGALQRRSNQSVQALKGTGLSIHVVRFKDGTSYRFATPMV